MKNLNFYYKNLNTGVESKVCNKWIYYLGIWDLDGVIHTRVIHNGRKMLARNKWMEQNHVLFLNPIRKYVCCVGWGWNWDYADVRNTVQYSELEREHWRHSLSHSHRFVQIVQKLNFKLTSESAPLSAPGHLNETYSWHRLWTTNEHTENWKENCKPLEMFLRDEFQVNEKIPWHWNPCFPKPLKHIFSLTIAMTYKRRKLKKLSGIFEIVKKTRIILKRNVIITKQQQIIYIAKKKKVN
jgi:hypothetical protein